MKMDVEGLFESQMAEWPEAAERYAALAQVRVKQAGAMWVQYNAARAVSTGAKVDSKTIAERKCFLCGDSRQREQRGIAWGGYEVLVNPFPIFARHFTIVSKEHIPQRLDGRVADMLRLAREMEGYTVFYNGACCGASAPDHQHFQAVKTECLPIWDSDVAPCLRLSDSRIVTIEAWMERLMAKVDCDNLNVLTRYDGDCWEVIAIPRRAHRPSFYGIGDDEYLISPASVDLGGVIITPREKDYERVDAELIERLMAEVCYSDEEINGLI